MKTFAHGWGPGVKSLGPLKKVGSLVFLLFLCNAVLLEAIAQESILQSYSMGDLIKAIHEDDLEKVREIAQKGGLDLNSAKTTLNNPLLVGLAMTSKVEMAKILLENGADVNIRNSAKSTPAMWAARLGHNRYLKALIEHKADLNKQNWSAHDMLMSALMYAARNAHDDTVKILLENGADKNLKNYKGETALSITESKLREIYKNNRDQGKLPKSLEMGENPEIEKLVEQVLGPKVKIVDGKKAKRYAEIYRLLTIPPAPPLPPAGQLAVGKKSGFSETLPPPPPAIKECQDVKNRLRSGATLAQDLLNEIQNADQKLKLKNAQERVLAPLRPQEEEDSVASTLIQGLKLKRRGIAVEESEEESDYESEDEEWKSPVVSQAPVTTGTGLPKVESTISNKQEVATTVKAEGVNLARKPAPAVVKVKAQATPANTQDLLEEIRKAGQNHSRLRKVEVAQPQKKKVDESSIAGILLNRMAELMKDKEEGSEGSKGQEDSEGRSKDIPGAGKKSGNDDTDDEWDD